MANIGDLKTIHSEQYGTYTMICIGAINLMYGKDNFLKKAMKDATTIKDKEKIQDEFNQHYQNWIKKYHPKTYFSGSILIPFDDTIINDWRFYVFVPLLSVNNDWFENNKQCHYFKQTKQTKKIKLPIGITDKQLDKWLQESALFLNTH